MFENLKAFIRHGKQANDMKRKQQQQPQQYQQPFSTATANENPFQQASNETPDSINVITPNDIINEYQQPDQEPQQYYPQQQQQQQDPYQQETQFQQQQQGVYTNYNQSDVTLNDKNADYNRVALQLVEEENEQRKNLSNIQTWKIIKY